MSPVICRRARRRRSLPPSVAPRRPSDPGSRSRGPARRGLGLKGWARPCGRSLGHLGRRMTRGAPWHGSGAKVTGPRWRSLTGFPRGRRRRCGCGSCRCGSCGRGDSRLGGLRLCGVPGPLLGFGRRGDHGRHLSRRGLGSRLGWRHGCRGFCRLGGALRGCLAERRRLLDTRARSLCPSRPGQRDESQQDRSPSGERNHESASIEELSRPARGTAGRTWE